ncbi:transporter [Coraliomargarita sinensis]|uniref:Transporter n=1 Tax=Coraliomargarita sinensis TaxID=2174842 RepID=A0A317ZE94_9BACT|nr:transporter [Coraliomargarita sinensis]PXA03510.1 transporter [Coraliomargarita sinensis]
MITAADYTVIALYFIFILAAGVLFRKFLSNTSDYFRGGGKMFWWMTGSSAFMTQFSAWTFIGAASKAYVDGPIILTIFVANAVGFFINYLLLAPMLRQTRVVTAIESIRLRLGKGNEQFYTWMNIPIGLIYAAIWLNAVGKFFTQAFPGFELVPTIIALGLVVMLVSVVGGSWAVSATDFIQLTLLMLVTIVTAAFSLHAVGGPGELIAQIPHESAFGNDVTLPALAVFWMLTVLLKQIISTNSMTNANRYLNARDSSHARKAALLASILFLVGSVIWFIPPMAASIIYPDIAGMVSPDFANPSELSYVVMAQNILPNGMIGLFIVGMFAATMSSMDTGLNKNAGYFIVNFYKPVLRKNSSEKEQFWAGNIASLVMGLAVIGIALYLEVLANQGEGKGLFEIMLSFGAIVAVPIAVPIILCLFIRNTPDWAGWSCALVGIVTAVLINHVFTAPWFEGLIGHDLSGREESDYLYIITVVLNVVLVSGWFFFTRLFYRGYSKERQTEVDRFWSDLHRPVEADEMTSELDGPQCRIIGWMAGIFGGFMTLLMVIIPNDLAGRSAFFFCSAVLLGVSFLLLRSAKRADARHASIK